MKALIFDSGIGKRMGEFTKSHHKSMAMLENGETIFERQIRLLSNNGIREFVVTTGPFREQIVGKAKKFQGLKFHFVENSCYEETNYIYSFYLTRDFLGDDFLMLHGDLVFDDGIVKKVLTSEYESACLIDETVELPEKDFKGRVRDGLLKEVSIHIFDQDCYAFQAFYKLRKDDLTRWHRKVCEFVEAGKTDVYAEEALNEILNDMQIHTISYAEHFVEEIDNMEDYERVKTGIQKYEETADV